ncbi:MAG TPA: SiaB family protein kinase [Bacteroidales bacterium]|nr:SiaB family protein kinase [Bacteroidales bacterium]
MELKNTNDLAFVEQIRKHIVDNNIMLSYQGEISQDIILALLNMTEKNLDSAKAEQAIKSKVFNVMVNCLQNITNHAEKNLYQKSSMFTVGRNNTSHTVYSGNAMKNENIPELTSKLDDIKKMSPEELDTFYRSWLQLKDINERKGMGLGLIDVARKTGSSLDYDFDEIDDNYSYFSLRTIIDSNKKGKQKSESTNVHTEQKSLRHYFNFHILAELNNIILLYSSDFTQELTKTLLAFTEKKLSSEDNVEDIVKRKVFNIMVELLQNISKNALDKDVEFSEHLPIFMIGETDSEFKLISSNKIYSRHIDKIKSRIDQVNALDSAGLKALYKEVRLQGKFSDVGGAGIGFIDMARKSGNKMLYEFKPIDEEHSIYTVQIEISKM